MLTFYLIFNFCLIFKILFYILSKLFYIYFKNCFLYFKNCFIYFKNSFICFKNCFICLKIFFKIYLIKNKYFFSGGLAAQFTRMLPKITRNKFIVTGNYLFDYQDTYRHFGAMIHGILIANPLTNIPEVIYVTLNNHGSGINLNHISVSFTFIIHWQCFFNPNGKFN